jgi:hypothetical protein
VDLPPSVAALLAGLPEHGQAEQAFPLLTVDEAGFPHVCLVSRAQLQADRGAVRTLVTSARTRANLLRDRTATLIAVGSGEAYYCKLRATMWIDEPWALAASLELVEHKVDRSPVPLAPMMYVPTTELEKAEQWDRGVALLRRLAPVSWLVRS